MSAKPYFFQLQERKFLCETIYKLLPLVGIMVVVGALIQVLALSGARDVISLHVVILPLSTLFATLFIILPISEEFGFKIKTIQTDNGREFCNNARRLSGLLRRQC